MIRKIILKNFKSLKNTEINCNNGTNILVGENNAGKTTILQAINLVLNGSYSQIAKNNLSSLFNTNVVSNFLNEKNIKNLPEVRVEIYLDESNPLVANNFDLEGNHNSLNEKTAGLILLISPSKDYKKEIEDMLNQTTWQIFPFEFYNIDFLTFSGRSYNAYSKPFKFKSMMIDTSLINTNNEIRKRISEVYDTSIERENRATINHKFRENSTNFLTQLEEDGLVSNKNSEYNLHFEDSEDFFRSKVSVSKNNVDIKNTGQGEKVLLSVENALNNIKNNIEVVLIEEPENHLSYLNMQKLIHMISHNFGVQIFIATHSNMIATRLGIDNLVFVSSGEIYKLGELQDETIKFFKKSTNQHLLNFILANKIILVEGNAEYILLEKFYKMKQGKEPLEDGVHIISVDGLSFKRYLEVAKQFSHKQVAVITDNDNDYEKNIINKYEKYTNIDNIKVFADLDNELYTFEVCNYAINREILEGISTIKTSDTLKYMIREKTETAFNILSELENNPSFADEFNIPSYIEEAIKWIVRD